MLGLLLCAGRVTLNVYRIIEVENMLHSFIKSSNSARKGKSDSEEDEPADEQ